MLNRCNILALVGGGNNPKFSLNKVILWDDAQSKEISELRFTSYIKNIKLKRTKIFIICETKIYVFQFENFQNIDTIETFANKKGIIGISNNADKCVIAYPDVNLGNVTIKNYDTNETRTINAHKGVINALSMNNDGTLLATASEKGTLIRIYRTKDGIQIQELRRGSQQSEIFCICFDSTSSFLACTSDHGTAHIFHVNNNDNNNNNNGNNNNGSNNKGENQKSFFGKITSFLNVQNDYLNSEWSFAQFKIPKSENPNYSNNEAIVAFGPTNTIIVVTKEGKYYQANFDPKNGGPCDLIQSNDVMNPVIEDAY